MVVLGARAFLDAKLSVFVDRTVSAYEEIVGSRTPRRTRPDVQVQLRTTNSNAAESATDGYVLKNLARDRETFLGERVGRREIIDGHGDAISSAKDIRGDSHACQIQARAKRDGTRTPGIYRRTSCKYSRA